MGRGSVDGVYLHCCRAVQQEFGVRCTEQKGDRFLEVQSQTWELVSVRYRAGEHCSVASVNKGFTV